MTSSGSTLNKAAWPSRSGPRFDEHGDFIQEEVQATVDSLTNNADPKMLSDPQAFQLMRFYRVAGAVSKNGVKWRSMGQLSELIAACFSATVPVLVGLTTQFDKATDPTPYWILTIFSIALSMLASIAVAVERVRGMKEQGVLERLEGADILLELKKFVGGCPPYSDNYRASFVQLTETVTTIQHKGTSDLYAAFKSRSQDKTAELNLGAAAGAAVSATGAASTELKLGGGGGALGGALGAAGSAELKLGVRGDANVHSSVEA